MKENFEVVLRLKKTQRILCIAVVFFWASEYCHAPYFTPYLTSLGFAAGVIGIMMSSYGFTQTLIRIPLGIFTDKTGGYLFVVRMGAVFTTVSSFGLIFATAEWTIVLCRVLAGIAASTWIAFTILFSAYYDETEGTSAMVSANMCNNGGKLLGFILGTASAAIWGYRVTLVMSFLTGAAAIIFTFKLKEVPIKREAVKFKALFSTFKDITVLLPAFFAILMQFILHGTIFSFTSNAAEVRGASEIQIGIVTTLFTLTQILAAGFMNRHVIKKLNSVWAAAAGFMLLGISCLVIAVTKTVWPIMLAQVIGGSGNLITASVLMGLTIKYVPYENKSTAMGLFQAIYGIGMTMGPIAVGKAVETGGYSFAYFMCAGICAAAFVLSVILLPVSERSGQNRRKSIEL